MSSGEGFLAGANFARACSRDDVEGRESGGGGAGDACGFEDGLEFACADDGVDFRNALADFVAVAFDEASGDD